MKCFETTGCSEQDRNACYVWNSFRANPQEMDNIKCWVLKGVYNDTNREHLKKCQQCKYYISQNRDTGISSQVDAGVAVVTLQGTLNNDRTKVIEKVWEELKAAKKFKILLDLSDVNNIYSCGLGILVKIHKETKESGGMLVIAGARGYVQSLFTSTKLSRILQLAVDRSQAIQIFEDIRKKEEEVKRAADEAAKPKAPPPPPAPPKKRIPCWDYFENHNPRNATTCDECFRKKSPSRTPCWIVEGMIEGVSFQYVNEDCESCAYFREFGTGLSGNPQIADDHVTELL